MISLNAARTDAFGIRLKFLRRMTEPHSSAATIATRILTDQFNSGTVKCIDDFHQTVDDTTYIAFAGFHPLNGWQGNAGHFRQVFWSIPRSARAARIWFAVIKIVSVFICE